MIESTLPKSASFTVWELGGAINFSLDIVYHLSFFNLKVFFPPALSALAELFLGLFLLISPSAAVPFQCHDIIILESL